MVRSRRNGSYAVGTRQRKPRRLWIWILACILAAGISWLLYVLAQIGSIDSNPAASREYAQPADVGIVLGASMWGDQPSPGLQERLELALQDYKEGKFRLFILSGGLDRADYRFTEAEGMANYLESKGVPRSAMLLENNATSTYENLKFSQEIMKEKGLKSVIIITHTYHGNRAYEIAKALGYDNPGLSVTKTRVIKPMQATVREVLAYTKWKLDHIAIAFGWK
ncbi:YdcF family protein [Paenibacillus vini]|uniref:YdcF family protein n=1 Tax=Paenibacillus vini TaxID=1476024 RepID=UPI001BCFD3E5|nr:YdcF family protein [Paenibacillus vini]